MGSHEQVIVSQCLRAREPIPARILNAPMIDEGYQFLVSAFFLLHTDRPIGFSEGRIPWSSQQLFANTYEMDREEADEFFYFIGKMDDTYLSFRERTNATKPTHTSPKKRGR